MPSSRRALFATGESSLSGLIYCPEFSRKSANGSQPRKERVPKFSSKDSRSPLSSSFRPVSYRFYTLKDVSISYQPIALYPMFIMLIIIFSPLFLFQRMRILLTYYSKYHKIIRHSDCYVLFSVSN